MRFKTSLKSARGRISWKLMAPQLTIMILSLVAIVAGFVGLVVTGFQKGPITLWAIGVFNGSPLNAIDWHEHIPRGLTVELYCLAAFWCLYGAVRAGFFIRKARTCATESHDFFRFKIPVPVELQDGRHASLTQLAEDWARMRLDQPVKTGELLTFTAFLPGGPLEMIMEVTDDGKDHCSGPLRWSSTEARDQLAASLYSVDWHREFLHRNAEFLAPSDLLLGLGRRRQPRMSWHAVLLQDDAFSTSPYGVLVESDRPGEKSSLITFTPLQEGAEQELLIFRPHGTSPARASISKGVGLQSLAAKGLDGAKPHRYEVII